MTTVPKISALLPVYNGERFLPETIESVLNQTFDDFEFLIVNEFGSNEEATAIVREYEQKDSRIRLIQNTERLGLPLSLNKGIEEAKGEYIARVDADDPNYWERFEKQVIYMDANPDVFLCGTLQRTIKPTGLSYEEYPTDAEELRTTLLFGCDISHCSVMMRRREMVENNWRYTDEFYAEDFDLWTRLLDKAKFVNLPERLVDHRWGFRQKSAEAIDPSGNVVVNDALQRDARAISARALKQYLGVNIEEYNPLLVLGGFRSQPWDAAKTDTREFLKQNFDLLREIENRNNELKVFEADALHNVLSRRWVKWVLPCAGNVGKCYPNKRFYDYKDIAGVYSISDKTESKLTQNTKFQYYLSILKTRSFRTIAKTALKKILRPFLGYVNRLFNTLNRDIYQKLNATEKQITSNTYWNRNQIIDLINSVNRNVSYVPYVQGEKVRILFIYLMPSLWPSWDTVLSALDKREDAEYKIMLFDVPIVEPEQIRGAEDFLKSENISYVRFDKFDINSYNPHIIVQQTPYDEYHRPVYLHAPSLRTRGYRIAYITYGIEIAKTNSADVDHFKRQVVQNCWRVYTFSPAMRADYLRYIDPTVVKALGHPKFDKLCSRSIPKNVGLLERAAGRKIVLLKLHWPKKDGANVYSPELSVYVDLLKHLPKYEDLFFAIMPHPNFFFNIERWYPASVPLADEIRYAGENMQNAMLCMDADYRHTLVCADFVITDRSAVMVESGVLGVPILYMTGNNWEPMNDAVLPIITSYYQGKSCDDMLRFLDMCRKGQDPKRTERRKAIDEYIPYFDGKTGERIAEDMVKGVMGNQS